MDHLSYRCQCGQTELLLRGPSPKTCTRLACYCVDCQSFVRHFNREDMMDAYGGTDLAQVDPGAVQIPQGQDNLVPLRLSPKGMFRWYARCCNTPMANGGPNAGLPFLSLLAANAQGDLDKALGKKKAQVNTLGAYGSGRPGKDRGFQRVIWKFLTRAIASRLNGNFRKNPFWVFPQQQPIAQPVVLTKDERRAAQKRS